MQNFAKPLGIGRYSRIVVLSGAGISVASGLRPYRGPGGLWEEKGVADLATSSALAAAPHKVWALFGPVRAQALAAQPNAAHLALAAAERHVPQSAEFTLLTQNIDGLHQRAGSRNVVELHGTAFKTRCANSSCDLPPYEDREAHTERVPICDRCGSILRPDVVLFEEPIPGAAEWASKRSLRDCDLFVAIGTSGTVSPASNFVRGAEYAGARTVLVNLEPMKPRHPAFQEEYLGTAQDLVPLLFAT